MHIHIAEIITSETTKQLGLALYEEPDMGFIGCAGLTGRIRSPLLSFGWRNPEADAIMALAREIDGRGQHPEVHICPFDRHCYQIWLILRLVPGNEVWLQKMLGPAYNRRRLGYEQPQLMFTSRWKVPEDAVNRFAELVTRHKFFVLELRHEDGTRNSQILTSYSTGFPP